MKLSLSLIFVTLTSCAVKSEATAPQPEARNAMEAHDMAAPGVHQYPHSPYPRAGESSTEAYDRVVDNAFLAVKDAPLSTFSIDVDTASYSNVRRFLAEEQLPPKDAVRVEEMINYFSYDYPDPKDGRPFAVQAEVSAAPWAPEHRLVHIGLQGKRVAAKEMPARNLVFLIDVSGSMQDPNKLPLLKQTLRKLINTMGPEDNISLVTYAGSSGLVLPPTSGQHKDTVLEALDRLEAGGSTNGGEGIELAYNVAQKQFVQGGVNRVLLATDGDFNVGTTSQGELLRLIEQERTSGVYLTVLGFGMGNYKDSTLEKLADNGNGNYAYIDNEREAEKVLVEEGGSTLVTIAEDVKIQVEWNPEFVGSYRLIGYENRALQNRDFNDDRKDAGEIGAGHSVTALYEITLPGDTATAGKVDPLKYQAPSAVRGTTDELLTVKVRYKQPGASESQLFVRTLPNRAVDAPSESFRFSAAVAAYGMLLRDSDHKGRATYGMVRDLVEGARGFDPGGHRAEFLGLVRTTERLGGGTVVAPVGGG
jgi:Ca-activated chloride channel homolog